MSKLKGKTAVITGATSGIGYEISLMLINQGVNVYLIGRSFERLSKVISVNKKIHFIQVDLEDDKDFNKIMDFIKIEDTIDILIHSAGIISMGLFEEDLIENFDKQYKVNVRASYLLTQKLLPKIKKSKGDIIFINSTAGLDSWENISQYSASKHALKALAKSIRLELRNDRIKVSNLYLGSVDTPMQEKVQQLKGNIYDSNKFINPIDIADIIKTILCLPINLTITDLTIRSN